MKQAELIKQMSPNEIRKSLLLSQGIILVFSLLLSVFLFDSMGAWFLYIAFDLRQIIYYGIVPGLLVVSIDLILMTFLPKRFYDDGGINEKIFTGRSIKEIFILTLFIAIAEEMLFRGVIQTTWGYLPASLIFALVHFRYLKKPVLLVSVLLLSFYIGYLFLITGNLLVTMSAHFIINFSLGLVIRSQK